MARRDGTGRRDGAHLSQDTSLRDLITELLETIKRGERVQGQKRNLSVGQIYIFRVGSAGVISPDERFRRCVQWMKDNQITNRRAWLAGCPDAGGGARMHARCIKQLRREGLIERIGREYVFKDE
jgi:hypothetical protein